VISISLGGVAGVIGATVGVASGTAIRVSSSIAIEVASSAVIRVASSRGIVNLSKVKLSQSCRATVIISLILIRAKPISLFIYL
jgi:hypothetical protein